MVDLLKKDVTSVKARVINPTPSLDPTHPVPNQQLTHILTRFTVDVLAKMTKWEIDFYYDIKFRAEHNQNISPKMESLLEDIFYRHAI